MPKNKITTQGYFIKRLRDYGFHVSRLFDGYRSDDRRKWTVIVNPTRESLLITCFKVSDFSNSGLYEINDGGNNIPKNFSVNTDSIEVVAKYLEEFNIEKVYNQENEQV